MFDEYNIFWYFGVLERILEVFVVGKSSLELKVVVERSLDKYIDGW